MTVHVPDHVRFAILEIVNAVWDVGVFKSITHLALLLAVRALYEPPDPA